MARTTSARWGARGLAVVAMAACAPAEPGLTLTDPNTPWPRRLVQLGSVDEGEFVPDDPRAVAYDVAFPLWSGGSDKSRYLLVPEEGPIDNRDRERWSFARGTVAIKTFSYDGRALETRMIRYGISGWEYAVYLWSEDGAALLDNDLPTKVELDDGGVYTVPAQLQCKQCHETATSPLIAVTELQLGAELGELEQRGALMVDPPAHPIEVEHPDPTTAGVLGWFVGNCQHCHNGGSQENASFDLSPGVALANTVGMPTQSSASAAGIRVVAGEPDKSLLYLAISGDHDNPDLKDMPPVGVDRRDIAGIAAVRHMIESMKP